jgi:transglutaminase-like putative cysteine protease
MNRGVGTLWIFLAFGIFVAPASATDSPAYAKAVESSITIKGDLGATIETTVRQKILKESAIRLLGQTDLHFAESVNPLEILEAFTEKPDGRRLLIEPSKILTRDGATGLNAVYQRDARIKTLIFPDIAVGDTLAFRYRNQLRPRRSFSQSVLLARSVPYRSYRLTVEAPTSIGLRTSAVGEDLSSTSFEVGGLRHHVFTYAPKVWSNEEPGAVSAWDRDPQIVLTTFNSMGELGASYWSTMGGKDIVTPEIQQLADRITAGIQGRQLQAVAIERWVKKNIRYVLVYLGSGGSTPNPAWSVLKNGYGDCKDHVVLTSALLNAKGIASEQVLISMGTNYRLRALPVPQFNHVMLYLPEFDSYTDPTASSAAFGVLPPGSYDKPVLHISPAGGKVARTPPMKAEDHATLANTTVWVSEAGLIRGETRQVSTGVFAAISREIVGRIETQGAENYAVQVLRSLHRPGTGVFERAMQSDYSEPFTLAGSFALNEALQLPLSAGREIPIGMPVLARPGLWIFGQRIAKRISDFPCFAATQVEEIQVVFATGLSLPSRPKDEVIDTPYFIYRSVHDLDGRTLKIRREFVSRVKGQVCSAQLEPELGPTLDKVARSLGTRMSFGGASADG